MDSFSDALRFLKLVVRNFLSFGPEDTVLDLSQSLLTAVIGINYDTGGEDSRNGTGKSALLIDAISYALFGETIRGVTKAHLVHKLARKGQPMMVTLEYQRGPFRYLIERGENPSKLNWFRKPLNDERGWRATEMRDGKKSMIFDQSRSKPETNEDIVKSVGFDMTLFTYLIGNSSEAVPFIRLREDQRRDVIESLFGFKRLSQIADLLKKDRDVLTRTTIGLESSIAATEAANQRIQAQIDGLLQKQADYYKPYEARKRTAELRLNEQIHHDKDICLAFEQNAFVQSLPVNLTDRIEHVAGLPGDLENLDQLQTAASQYERDLELVMVRLTEQSKTRIQSVEDQTRSLIDPLRFPESDSRRLAELGPQIRANQQQIEANRKTLDRLNRGTDELTAESNKLDQSLCPSCGQSLTVEHKAQETARISAELNTIMDEIEQVLADQAALNTETTQLQTEETQLRTKQREMAAELTRVTAERETILTTVHLEESTKQDGDEEVLRLATLLDQALTALDRAKELAADRTAAIELAQEFMRGTDETNRLIAVILEADEALDPEKNPDPYTEQIESLRKNALVDIRETKQEIADNRLVIDHYQLLVELATKKDSFIRKKLIDRWLPYLNRRIAELLAELELPHKVRFDSEMEIHVSMLQGEYHNGNLSKGERMRLIVAVNISFQELFEQMNYKVNLLVVDELIDTGICNRGAENAVRILSKAVRDHGKRAFLITHREDIRDQVDSTMTVFKENDFSHLRWNN